MRFLDSMNENALIDEQQVEWGLSAVVPEPPIHAGYTFKGWDMEFDIVTSNLDVIAQYDESTGMEKVQRDEVQCTRRGSEMKDERNLDKQ